MRLKTMRDVGLIVRQVRRARRLTQAQLAERVGSNQEWISKLETSRIDNPSLGTILRAFHTLGIDLVAEIRLDAGVGAPSGEDGQVLW